MTAASVRLAVGTKITYDGELVEIIEIQPSAYGNQVLLRNNSGRLVRRVAVKELLSSRGPLVPVGEFITEPEEPDRAEPIGITLAELTAGERELVLQRSAHVREVLTGYRSGSSELAASGEPRPEFDPTLSLTQRYATKAAELGIGVRTVRRWVAEYRRDGEAGLAQGSGGGTTRVDPRWTEIALEVMVELTDQSRPSRTMVITWTNARFMARHGPEDVTIPSRATAFRVLEDLERRHPTFRLSTKRNRDIADRPDGVYGKLRPTRPGEYLLIDTTRLDVFALDPVTLQWVQVELTVGMDWYTRCIVGIRVTPVSTKSIDAAATIYQAFRPPPAGRDWPQHAVWPEHGVPRSIMVDRDAIDGPLVGASGPRIVPETIVVDHGKIYLSAHMTSLCQRLGISIQPARLRTGRDKGPVERFFRTVREDLLQVLEGYKGPDVHSRGLNPEADAFFYLDELEDIIREWVATVYHHRPHRSLVDPHLPKMRMSPAAMFEHGIARAGYIEEPADPDLAFDFLKTEWRTIQHYGIDYDTRRYNGTVLNPYRNEKSDFRGPHEGLWPIHVNPDDVSRIYFNDPETRRWHALAWEHAPSLQMPLSEDALQFARRLAAAKYTYPDDEIAVADLFERWNLGLGRTRAERRIALRLARQASTIVDDCTAASEQEVSDLPSVTRALAPDEDHDRGDDRGEGAPRRNRRARRSKTAQTTDAPPGPTQPGDHSGQHDQDGRDGAQPDTDRVELGDDDDIVDLDDFYTGAMEDV